ncbi:hypothetical protein [Nocardia sp. NPDC050175]|uniref:hypothetical protein n=1 Tax=Nocardia sp. NPDC050175 TaxID=3364317 RepID=UPI0037ACEAA6
MKRILIAAAATIAPLILPTGPANAASAIVVLFADSNFAGDSESFDKPTNCVDVSDVLMDDVSSIIVPKGYEVVLYEHPSCVGSALGTLKAGGHPDLGSANDRTASLRAFRR